MFISFNKVFHPTPEEKRKQIEFLNKLIRYDLDENGATCSTCEHARYVQPNQFYDYITCEFDTRVELPYCRNERKYCCNKYEFRGFLEENNE